KLLKNPDQIKVLGDGTQTRDFIYVDDLIMAILHVAFMGELNGSAYNVGTGHQVSTSSIVNHLITVMGTETEVKYSRQQYPGYPEHWCADIEKLSQLGWRASVSLEAGLRRTVDWILREYPQH